jgi:hypothetical protein
MEPVKRIDLVVPEIVLREVTELLERHGAGGYTIARGLVGKGHRGVQTGEGLAGEFSNAGILVVCAEPVVAPLLEDLRGLIARYGGLCLVSDAVWLKH